MIHPKTSEETMECDHYNMDYKTGGFSQVTKAQIKQGWLCHLTAYFVW